MPKVLVTGATGFLGYYIIKYFSEKKFEIIALGRNIKKGNQLEKEFNCTFYQVDLINYEEIKNIFKDVNIVVHAAALSTIWGKWNDFYINNVVSTKNIVKACLENKVQRLIFVSSPSIYSFKGNKLNIKEKDFNPNNKLNNYIKSKILAEKEIKNGNEKGLYTVILRPRGIFGIGDTSIIPRLLSKNNKKGIPLINGGQNIVDITYVENVAHAIYLSATKENINGQTFNITNDTPRIFKELIDLFLKEINIKPKYRKLKFKSIYFIASIIEIIYKTFQIKKEPTITKYLAITISFSQSLDISKAKNLLDYTPIFTLEEGIRNYCDWYRKKNKSN